MAHNRPTRLSEKSAARCPQWCSFLQASEIDAKVGQRNPKIFKTPSPKSMHQERTPSLARRPLQVTDVNQRNVVASENLSRAQPIKTVSCFATIVSLFDDLYLSATTSCSTVNDVVKLRRTAAAEESSLTMVALSYSTSLKMYTLLPNLIRRGGLREEPPRTTYMACNISVAGTISRRQEL